MPTDEERREVAEKVRNVRTTKSTNVGFETLTPIEFMCGIAKAIGFGKQKDGSFVDPSYSEFSDRIADLIEPEHVRTCKWVWGEDWTEFSPEGPRELQWANWYLNCGCYCGDESEFDDLDDPYEKPYTYWQYCPYCGAKVVDE